MKTLFFIRHAKSSWAYPDLDDVDRPLNSRGEKAAPFMGSLLAERQVKADLILSSPANRALTTARIIAEKLNYPAQQIRIVPKIYGGSANEIIDLVKGTDEEANTIMVFGHNPEFTTIANYFSSNYIDNVPTCGVVAVEVGAEHWRDLSNSNSRLLYFDYPKKHHPEL